MIYLDVIPALSGDLICNAFIYVLDDEIPAQGGDDRGNN